ASSSGAGASTGSSSSASSTAGASVSSSSSGGTGGSSSTAGTSVSSSSSGGMGDAGMTCTIGAPGGQTCTTTVNCPVTEANIAACSSGACTYAPLGEPIACGVTGGAMQIDGTYAYVAASPSLWRVPLAGGAVETLATACSTPSCYAAV